jgi:hypothetical protein
LSEVPSLKGEAKKTERNLDGASKKRDAVQKRREREKEKGGSKNQKGHVLASSPTPPSLRCTTTSNEPKPRKSCLRPSKGAQLGWNELVLSDSYKISTFKAFL